MTNSARQPRQWLAACALAASLAACAAPSESVLSAPAEIPEPTSTQKELAELPPPTGKVAVAVYSFLDRTGKYERRESIQTLSRAVTQGGETVLIKALKDTGNGAWFTVVERASLNNLLKERQIITEMRQRYLGEQGVNPNALPPLLFAGVLLEGGIIGFDSNTMTGGAGARLLGIGGNVEYRQDTVTIYLRAVSVKTGEVLATVTTRKTIASFLMRADVFKFISFDDVLELEAGFTHNEPSLVALQQAIEKGVYALIIEGSDQKLWRFANPQVGEALRRTYRERRQNAAIERKLREIPEGDRGKRVRPARNEADAS